jgi:hypothetical protein
MKTVQTLASATKDMKMGNHRVRFIKDEKQGINGRDFFYYDTIICGVDDNRKLFYIDASYGSVSTTRACNAYRKHFIALGYTEIDLHTGIAV